MLKLSKLSTAVSLASIKSGFGILSGGRPMTFEGFLFRDVVSGERVNLYTDLQGRKWMATSSWALFRVPHES